MYLWYIFNEDIFMVGGSGVGNVIEKTKLNLVF